MEYILASIGLRLRWACLVQLDEVGCEGVIQFFPWSFYTGWIWSELSPSPTTSLGLQNLPQLVPFGCIVPNQPYAAERHSDT